MFAIVLAALLGILARTLVPYLQLVKDAPQTKFDRAFFVPAIASVLVSLVTAPLVLAGLPADVWTTVTVQGWIGVFVAAWGLTDIARAGQKLIG